MSSNRMEETSVVLDNMLDEVPKIQAAIAAYQEDLNALWTLVDDAIDADGSGLKEALAIFDARLGRIVQAQACVVSAIKDAALIERVVEEFEEIDFS